MYKHVAFDVDGTIINTDAAWLEATQRTVREQLEREIPKDELKYTLGMPDDWIYQGLGVDDPGERVRIIAVQSEYYLEQKHTNCYYDGMLELFDALRARGVTLGVVTSRSGFEFDDRLWLDIAGRFGIVVSGDSVSNLKPHPEPLEQYVKRAGVDKSQVLFVGDSRFDAGCAQNAGVDFALATWGTHDPELPATYKPKNPLDILGWV